VENFGRLYGSNQPISAHFTAFNSSDQLQRKRSSIFQEALINYETKSNTYIKPPSALGWTVERAS